MWKLRGFPSKQGQYAKTNKDVSHENIFKIFCVAKSAPFNQKPSSPPLSGNLNQVKSNDKKYCVETQQINCLR